MLSSKSMTSIATNVYTGVMAAAAYFLGSHRDYYLFFTVMQYYQLCASYDIEI
jgi:hypothetical protein